MRFIAAFVLLPSLAMAQTPPPLPERVCVNRALIEKWAALTVARPWNEVAAVMDDIRMELRAPQSCPVVETPPASASKP